MIDAKDALPQGFTPVEKTTDTGEETSTPPFSLSFFWLVFVSFFSFFFNSASGSGRGPPRQLCWR